MVVAGGPLQVFLVQKTKEMGCFVLNTSLENDSPGFQYADLYSATDVLDIDKQLSIAVDFKPDAIVTDQSDLSVPTVAYLCERLGLIGIGVKKADLFTNKHSMREFCSGNNVPYPDYCVCISIEDAVQFLDKHGKIIIKPLDSQASKGVQTILTPYDLLLHFENTKQFSRTRKAVLAEEFIEGTEFTVDGIKTFDKHISLAVSQKAHYKSYSNVASSLLFSHTSGEYDYNLLRGQNDSLVEKMGLPFGLTHAEYIERNGVFYLVEIAARGGGAQISSKIVPFMSGVQNTELLIRMALGERIYASDVSIYQSYNNKKCILEFFVFNPGVVKEIKKTALDSCKDVLDYTLNIKPGEVIGVPSDDTKRPGYYIAGATSIRELNTIRNTIMKGVVVEYV